MRSIYTPFLFLIILFSVISVQGCLEIPDEYVSQYKPELGITFHQINGNYTYAERYIANASLKLIRYDIEWKKSIPQRGAPDYSYIFSMINISIYYKTHGYRQIVVLWSPPDWVSDYPPTVFTNEYLKFLSLYMNSSGFSPEIIQIGNEPNNPIHSAVFNTWNSIDIHNFIQTASDYIKTRSEHILTAINFQVIPGWQYKMETIVRSNDQLLNIDILAVDYYPGTWNIGSLKWSAFGVYLDYLDRYGIYKGGVFETGYSTPNIEADSEYHQHVFYSKDIPYLIDLMTQYNYDINSETSIDYLLFYSLENLNTYYNNPERNFGLIVFDRNLSVVHYKLAYFDVMKLSDYKPKIAGTGVRLPLYGIGFTVVQSSIYFSIIFLSSFIIGYTLYVTIISNGEFSPDIDRVTRLNRAIFGLKYAVTITLVVMLLSLIPTTLIYTILIIPISYYIATRNIGYLFASLSSITIVYILYIVMLQFGLFIV